MKKTLVHLVGVLPPSTSGITDYAITVSAATSNYSEGKISSSAFGLGQRNIITRANAVFGNSPNADQSLPLLEIVRKMQPDAILLHYVGYAYHIRGAPLWLIPFIKAVLRQSPNTRLITMFHELFATGKPWESSYWFSPLQRLVAHELSKLSHLRFASTTHAADWLSSISKPFQPQPVVLPICSTIGEPPEITAYTNRLPIAIVFNGGGPWREVLRANGAKILTLLRSMGIHRIVQMGSIPGPFVSEAGTECEQLGPQPAEVVCKTLSKAAISVVAYPSWLTEKSTLLAACAVNGTPVLIFDKDGAWRLHLSKDRKPSFEAVQKDEVPQQKDLVSSSSANCGWYHAKAHSKWHANAIAKALGL